MNKIIKYFAIILLTAVCAVPLFAQQTTDFRINEILIKNDSNYVDEYGRHVAWVEIFNTAYNSVNLSECYLTDDTTGFADGSGFERWYKIPKGDPNTLIQQRSTAVFFMDNSPLYGTFHVNFDLHESKTNYIALIASDGKTLVDLVEYPAELKDSTVAYGRPHDGEDELCYLEYFTPGSLNQVTSDATKAEKLLKDDPYGIGLAIISITAVFTALAVIYLMLKLFGHFSRKSAKPKEAKKEPKKANKQKADANEEIAAATAVALALEDGASDEEIAAIATAIHLHLNSLHDEESEIITIDAQYTPWSQKNLTMKRVQRKM